MLIELSNGNEEEFNIPEGVCSSSTGMYIRVAIPEK